VEVVLDDKEFVTQHKSAILKAVESMYDDEYDDTYDSMGLTNNTETSFKLVDAVNEDEGNSTQPQQLVRPLVVTSFAFIALLIHMMFFIHVISNFILSIIVAHGSFDCA
jgi:hypothetical protein